ncbi:hypothetical protein L210DRAFT_3575527, partial [Boletus edulis BED1]
PIGVGSGAIRVTSILIHSAIRKKVEKKYNLITRWLREVLKAGRPRPTEEPLQPDAHILDTMFH